MAQTKFDREILFCNDDYVAVRLIEDSTKEMKIGSIYLTPNIESNSRLSFAKILKAGKNATEEYGLNEGDYVMVDALASFGHTTPVATMRYNNVIYKTTEDKSKNIPLKNMVFVEPINEGPTKFGNFELPKNESKLHLGKIIDMNIDGQNPFSIGDTVILTTGADNVDIGSKTIRIYKKDMLVCTIKDDENI